MYVRSPAARSVVASLDRGVAIADVTTMDDVVSRALARPRFQLTLLALCAGVALMLAAAGVYGVVSYAVARRSLEIGLRMAIGAQQGQVRRMVVQQSFRHGVRPGDPATFVVATLLLMAVALLASGLPAWRASRIDPIIAMREQ